MDEESEGVSVPPQFALKSFFNKRYLCFVREGKDFSGYLKYCADKVVSPYTKFEIEESKVGKGMVHIRCCYNNRYWVLDSESSHYIVAAAKKTEEDQSKYTCTLFKPKYDYTHNAFRFQCVHLNSNLHLNYSITGALNGCLFIAPSFHPEIDKSDLATVMDWSSLCSLPRYVAFKGDNGCYLRPSDRGNGKIYLQFCSSDVSDPGIKHEIQTTPDGHVVIKNVCYRKYWAYDPTWIMLKNDVSTDSPDAMFWPVRVENNVVALRNMKNNCFCKRLSVDNKDNCLNANVSSITDEARIEITELVLSREIYNINFHLPNARVYNQRPLCLATGTDKNLKDVADKVSVKLAYEDTSTSTWNSSVYAKFGVSVTVKTGIPKVSETEVEVSAEIGEEYEWGETEQQKNLVEVTHEVTVPPWTKVKNSIMAIQATCDVPFSYTQKDKLMNGKTVIRRLDDGIFTGLNSYNYQFVAENV